MVIFRRLLIGPPVSHLLLSKEVDFSLQSEPHLKYKDFYEIDAANAGLYLFPSE